VGDDVVPDNLGGLRAPGSAVLAGVGALGVRLRLHLAAKYQGGEAERHGLAGRRRACVNTPAPAAPTGPYPGQMG
jgi:hypothetical protein